MLLQSRKFASCKRTVFILSFLALSLFNFIVFWVFINFDTIKLTLYDINEWGDEIYVGLKNYKLLFEKIFVKTSSQEHTYFWNSFKAVWINLIILPISIIVAYAFSKKVYGNTFFRIIFFLPSVISIVVLAAAFREMFRQYNDGTTTIIGPVATILKAFGINKSWLDPMKGPETVWPLVYLFAILNGLGTNVILISSAMQRIPKEVSEASRLDGCGFWKELTFVSLPLVMPTITTWVMMIFASAYGFFMQPMLLLDGNAGVNGAFSTAPWQIFNLVTSAGLNKGPLITAATIGIALTIVVLPINLIMRAILNRFTAEVTY